jgi:glutathione S-transferase
MVTASAMTHRSGTKGCGGLKIRLYVVPGSNASLTGRLLLDHKGIEYERKDLVPGAHVAILKTLGFPDMTVPAIKIDGRRVQGTPSIARALEELWPDPPLFPVDPARREAVEDAERFGEQELQHAARRLFYCAGRRDPENFRSVVLGGETKLGPARRLIVTAGARAILWAATQGHGATDEVCRQAIRDLPRMLDRIDAWIEAGVLDAEVLTAADFQTGVNLRLLLLFEDIAPWIEGRPAARLAHRVAPVYPGRVRAVFPPEWLEPLHGAAPAPPEV